MGDRGNIVMRYDNDKAKDVYFYTHWRGRDLPKILHSALSHKQRWEDEPYLSRAIFHELTKNASDQFTGFGISPFLTDNEHNILVVDHAAQSVIEQTEEGVPVNKWSFREFVALDIDRQFAGF